MANNNQIVLIGNVHNELKLERKDEHSIMTVVIACPRYHGEVDYVTCKFWDRQAEILADYVRTGQLLSVTGSLRVESPESFYVNGSCFQMLGKKPG